VKTKAGLSSDIRGMGYIYLITNTVNGKRYVGQTQREDIETRWRQHRSIDTASIGRYISSAYKKYGINKFKFQIICICFNEACNLLETEYIKKFNTLSPNGYNLKEGGNNSRCHPDTKLLLSNIFKGRIITPMTNEIKEKISLANKGKNNANFGKVYTTEERMAKSKKMKEVWKKRKESNITRSLINDRGLFVKGQISNRRKSVGKYDKEGNLLDTYPSTVEAGLAVGIGRTAIGAVCRGVKSQKTAAGFVWKFLSNDKIAS
jgi:group I intron endonuclease